MGLWLGFGMGLMSRIRTRFRLSLTIGICGGDKYPKKVLFYIIYRDLHSYKDFVWEERMWILMLINYYELVMITTTRNL